MGGGQGGGWDATDAICRLLIGGKFLPQLHLVLIDGIGFGGFNLIDLPTLASRLQIPCVAVMRRLPNLAKIETAMSRLPSFEKRLAILQKAGEIYVYPPYFFQVSGADADTIAAVLHRLTNCGKVPEALGLAHLIGAAVMFGESGSSA